MGFFALEAFIGYVRPQSRGTHAPHQSVCVQCSGGGEDGATSENFTYRKAGEYGSLGGS